MVKSIQNISYRAAGYFHLLPFVFVTITGLPGRIKINKPKSMNKYIALTLMFILTSIYGYSQTKPSPTEKPKQDTVLITLSDINETLNFLSDKISHKEFEQAQQYYLLLYKQAIQRKSKPKK